MTQADHSPPRVTPRLRRGLAAIWLGIVFVVGLCLFLAMRWNIGRIRTAAESTAAAAQTAAAQAEQGRAATEVAAAANAASPTPPPTSPAETSRPTATPLPVADRAFGYGIQVQPLDDAAARLDDVQQLGLGWVKLPVRWKDVEPQPGARDWAVLDEAIAAANARNLKVLVTVYAAPDWSRSVTAEGRDGPPDNPQTYVAFVSQLVQRYHGAIHAVEVWSEMNYEHEWYVAGGISSQAYLDLLVPTAAAIRAVDPGIIVVSGGLNPTGIDDGIMAVDDFRYLRELIDGGLLSVVDCVGVHHKGYNLAPDVPYDTDDVDLTALFEQPYENPHHSWSFYSTLRGYNDMIVTAGWGTPLCVTEFGWASIGAMPRQPVAEFVYDNTLEEQAAFTVEAFGLMREWDFVWMAFLVNLDYTPEPESDDALLMYYRIVAPGGASRPVYDAIQAMDKQP
jgi:hypothetical protein